MNELTEEEKAWIEGNADRCSACGHREIFHNDHCCSFCNIPGCECEWGEMPKPKAAKK